ncbi:PTS glucose transporter subunit IIA [Paenibacillus selenitireducens]|uniref:PTS glucose transporter subunit IIA n=1 Tax=Paenibacillus selenitireducens TaxID=1324314 RepID=A0A1T2XFD0_9BACL|nr:glucose PTS transporter subunit IIA [Paenibacillus selenitireducens]OPA78538.1 PTS glucose transporter subunit IIA [Paenibacillus selenitireducens]
MSALGTLQQFGRAIMLPTVVLPVASLMLFLGSFPWDPIGLESVGHILTVAGSTIFTFLPYIFAVGVALGLGNNDGTAAIAALIGIFIVDQVTSYFSSTPMEPSILVGILIGILAGYITNRYKHIQLPEYIQFFGGPRFVLLVMCFSTLIFAALMTMIAEPLEQGVVALGKFLLSLGGIGVFLFGVMQRVLVVVGLHHILNNVFFFQVGSFETTAGQIVHGDLPRFFAGDPTAGQFMTGLYPLTMFAIPAIAFAIIQEAREDLKPKVKKMFLMSAFVSFLTGITEPIEFAFLFVAPYLFVVHALISGFTMWLCSYLDIHLGVSFSGGAIDFVLSSHLGRNQWLLIPMGLALGLIYYNLFRFAINKYRIPTPGREEGSVLDDWAGSIPYRAPLILQALGGKENIVQMEACVTRLRLSVKNDRLIDRRALRLLGSAGMIRLGGGAVQVVFGTYSDMIRAEIMKVLNKDVDQVLFHAPMQGKMIPLDEVPDHIFAKRLVGNGVAFIPDKGEMVAPLAGEIMTIYPTQHAIGIVTAEGLNVLIHLGIDTSSLNGYGITVLVKEGDHVEAGQLLMKFDLEYVKKHAASIVTPMVITNSEIVRSWSFAPYKPVKKGQASVMSVVLNDRNVGGNAE